MFPKFINPIYIDFFWVRPDYITVQQVQIKKTEQLLKQWNRAEKTQIGAYYPIILIWVRFILSFFFTVRNFIDIRQDKIIPAND